MQFLLEIIDRYHICVVSRKTDKCRAESNHLVKVMIRTLSLACIVVLLVVSCALADIPIEGVTEYDYEYNLTNAWMYPEYMFLTSSLIWGWDEPRVIQNGTFGGGYKLDSFLVSALRKDAVNSTVLDMLNRSGEEGSEKEADGTLLSEYLSNAPVISANISLPVGGFFEDTLNIESVTVNLKITGFSDADMAIVRDTALFRYKDGKTAEMNVNKGEEIIPPSVP